MILKREEALALLEEHLEAEHMRRHCLAAEAILRDLAAWLGHDPEKWGLAGLLHDLDHYQTRDHPALHTLVTATLLEKKGVDPEVIQAIKAHNAEELGLERRTPLDYALSAAETMSGMVVAATLVLRDKKIRSLPEETLVARVRDSKFALAVNRDKVCLCEKIGLSLEEFAALSLKAMSRIDKELGL
ncbi:MAG: HDIG domain-containing metalloprotein [Thermodesulfobacteriota bacterium]